MRASIIYVQVVWFFPPTCQTGRTNVPIRFTRVDKSPGALQLALTYFNSHTRLYNMIAYTVVDYIIVHR